jgi:hypothetical protein
MIQCSMCKVWLHLKCSNLPAYQLYNFTTTQRRYQCEVCTSVPTNFRVDTTDGDDIHPPEKVELATLLSTSTQTDPIASTPTSKQTDPDNHKEHCLVAIRDLESKLVDNILKISRDAASAKLESSATELLSLRADLKTKQLRIETLEGQMTKLASKVMSFIPTIVGKSTDECTSCPQLKKQLAELDSKLTRTVSDNGNLTRDNILFQSLMETSQRSQTLSDTNAKACSERLDTSEDNLRTATRHIDDLKSELLSIKCSSPDGGTFTEVQKKMRHHVPLISTHNRFSCLDSVVETSTPITEVTSPIADRSTSVDQPQVIISSTSGGSTSRQPSLTQPPNNPDKPQSRTDKASIPARNAISNVDVLIVGNSHTHHLRPYSLFPGTKSYVNTLNEKDIVGAHNFIESLPLSPRLKLVTLQVSDNALDMLDVYTCVRQLEDLVSLCQVQFPKAIVSVVEALPRRLDTEQATSDYNKKMTAFNMQVSKLPAIKVISTAASLKTVSRDLFRRDGIHLNRQGTCILVSSLRDFVGPILGRDYDLSPPSDHGDHDATWPQQRPHSWRNSPSDDRDYQLSPSPDRRNQDIAGLQRRSQPWHASPDDQDYEPPGRRDSDITRSHRRLHPRRESPSDVDDYELPSDRRNQPNTQSQGRSRHDSDDQQILIKKLGNLLGGHYTKLLTEHMSAI